MPSQEPPSLGDFQGHEIYPMPMFATITVADVTAMSGWYQQTLGFSVVFAAPGSALVHLRRRKYQDLLIVRGSSASAAAPSSLTISFSVDGEIDDVAARAHAGPKSGVSAVTGPVATPWNTLDLRVTDPEGHQLIFTARNPNPDPEQVKRMQALFSGSSSSSTRPT